MKKSYQQSHTERKGRKRDRLICRVLGLGGLLRRLLSVPGLSFFSPSRRKSADLMVLLSLLAASSLSTLPLVQAEPIRDLVLGLPAALPPYLAFLSRDAVDTLAKRAAGQ